MTEGDEISGNTLDRSVLDCLRELQNDGDPDIIAEVGGLFIEHSPQRVTAILQAVKNGDADGLRIAAHNLKSSSAYVGAMRLSEISRELEMMGRSQVLDEAEKKAEILKKEHMRVIQELDAEIKRSN
ncbi:MAG TPA: Hpt domain-containing protein [Methanothrix sp.]|jgi:HPt (histidine-containing phosphotransfer) domain-containing protein|uniref:Hpt domain-containing protein n=1 Tax=Methanothrix sp. TaxID=90426 RepID=UPI002BDE8B9C|nr:Hpt domain-containing protein [Methanothrix sp.]MDI9416390.1 Hpt domain-containing protein [Euryarchaeota archaeon]HON34751.1 Hpt domain-containing protein [Methanothrix sp.]HRU74608.1 Hpt domain-containing protein [Methanothrix sp.]